MLHPLDNIRVCGTLGVNSKDHSLLRLMWHYQPCVCYYALLLILDSD